jgi:2-polyprenyl-3-methyl-5-hydroxy-6-metoxy-1,4-benzoquinol methylase
MSGVLRRLAHRLHLTTTADANELRARLNELEARWQALGGGVGALEQGVGALQQGVGELQAWNHGLDDRIDAMARRIAPAEELVAASRALPGGLPLEFFDAGPSGTVMGFTDTHRGVNDPALSYVAFEEVFRGSEELIRGRQQIYVPLLAGSAPILDVGCGRGELLDLLRDAGVTARGIDLDPAMVAHCREKGLEVEVADAVGYLTRLEDGSLGAIVAAQVIEHLPYAELVSFVHTAKAKLAPGGHLLLETVNPHAAHAMKTFWVDPTHQHPVFPEVTLALCRIAGFPTAYVFHPGGTGDAREDRFLSGDYAVVATLDAAG